MVEADLLEFQAEVSGWIDRRPTDRAAAEIAHTIGELGDPTQRSIAAVMFDLLASDEAEVHMRTILDSPSVDEWLARTRRRPSRITRAEIVETLDELRGEWPDARR